MALSRKGGRAKKSGDRYKCGLRIVPPDLGTPEQRLKREIAAGIRSVPTGGKWAEVLERVDSEKLQRTRTGTDAIDILLARRIIDRDQFEVALEFQACWCAYIGRPWPKGWKAERQSPDHNGGVSEAHLRRMKIRYWNCVAAMAQADRYLHQIVVDVVVHGKTAGLIEQVFAFDVVRQGFDGGGLINTKGRAIPPALRLRIGKLTTGLEIIAATPRGDYTREAEAMIAEIRKRERGLTEC